MQETLRNQYRQKLFQPLLSVDDNIPAWMKIQATVVSMQEVTIFLMTQKLNQLAIV